jgi:hypothetical protein
MLTCGSCNVLLCGLVGGFDSALDASANSFFHSVGVDNHMRCKSLARGVYIALQSHNLTAVSLSDTHF